VGKWRRWIRSGIIRGSRVWWIGALYRKACQLITWMVGHRLASIAGVEATYTRHSHPRFVTFAPGQSDLDLTLVLDDDAARNAAVVRTCADQVDALSGTFGFIFPQDARFVTRRELAQIEARPGAAEILSGPGTWIRIGGRELRQDRQLPIVASDHIVRHPEFNAWWLNVMQTPMLTPQTRLSEDELRLCFRVAMKNQLNLLVARGRMAPPTEPYLPDSSAASLFADDPEMTRLLGNLERTHFRTPDWKERKAGIFHRSLTLAADFAGIITGWIANTAAEPIAFHKFIHAGFASTGFSDFLAPTFRTMVFGLIIGVISCFQGMRSQGGTEGVGRSATSAVVLSSLFVMLADVILVKLILVFFP